MHVISYCNGKFLDNIKLIKSFVATTTFVNCMTWLFAKEKSAVKDGFIDYEIYQTQRVLDKNLVQLQAINPSVKGMCIKPYFDADLFPLILNRPRDKFRFGRIQREDAGKYHPKTLWIHETMTAPNLKEGIFLGFNKRIEKKIGPVPKWIKTYPAGKITQEEFYLHSQAIIQPCDVNHTENLPRIGFEAMASGTILIVDKKGGWQDIVRHGKTGWLCSGEREFAYYSSRCAFEHKEREKMAVRAREHLIENWGMDAAKEGWSKFFKEVGIL